MAERRGINEGGSSEFEGSSLLTFGKNDSARPATPKIEEVKAGKGSLSLVQFVAVLYFLCCGGPYGIEVAVKTGFPAIVFLMIFLVPFVWILPVGLVTCELGTAMPDNEGFIRWINAAWGPSLAFTAAVTYMVQLTCDNALYPILFAQYIASAMTPYPWYSDWMSVALRFLCILVAMVLNFFGLDVVGNYSSVFTFLTLSPFLVMVVWTGILGEIEPSDWYVFFCSSRRVH
jgi:amino acid transporter